MTRLAALALAALLPSAALACPGPADAAPAADRSPMSERAAALYERGPAMQRMQVTLDQIEAERSDRKRARTMKRLRDRDGAQQRLRQLRRKQAIQARSD